MFGFKKEFYTPEYQLVGDECAVIETSKGTIKVKFDGEGAPIHVANFCELSTMGFYDGLKFHRYVPGFVIQGGEQEYTVKFVRSDNHIGWAVSSLDMDFSAADNQ